MAYEEDCGDGVEFVDITEHKNRRARMIGRGSNFGVVEGGNDDDGDFTVDDDIWV